MSLFLEALFLCCHKIYINYSNCIPIWAQLAGLIISSDCSVIVYFYSYDSYFGFRLAQTAPRFLAVRILNKHISQSNTVHKPEFESTIPFITNTLRFAATLLCRRRRRRRRRFVLLRLPCRSERRHRKRNSLPQANVKPGLSRRRTCRVFSLYTRATDRHTHLSRRLCKQRPGPTVRPSLFLSLLL